MERRKRLSEDALLGRDQTPFPAPTTSRPHDLILLDRDGTLNVHRPGYISSPAELRLLPGAANAVRQLNALGAVVIVVTNQRGLATGALTAEQLVKVHRSLEERLARDGAHLDGIHVCPHDVGECRCRKPLPGLLEQALKRAPWAQVHRCLLLGDQPSDLAAAAALGIPAKQVGGSTVGSLQGCVRQLLNTD
ncbi:D-glycero-alpha-D-manno-heptose-1,7-bisphosphate 7-phosphatase [Demetria terragena]|uniref:D-glycero-alpha-D-manno-heptose-1,7-bisphosphate 7-phosphatase n=1 Tax=Demetria terragena TaxID=63959 RepID=UPI000374A582|nr:HAD-IIIA family hydrolase [Demetria terragena]